jgi:hypothetical protein
MYLANQLPLQRKEPDSSAEIGAFDEEVKPQKSACQKR